MLDCRAFVPSRHLCATPAPHLRSSATEAMALWRGVEAASGARHLLSLCGSIDIAPTRGSSAASEALGRMEDASVVSEGLLVR